MVLRVVAWLLTWLVAIAVGQQTWIALFNINGWLGFFAGVLVAVAVVTVIDLGPVALARALGHQVRPLRVDQP